MFGQTKLASELITAKPLISFCPLSQEIKNLVRYLMLFQTDCSFGIAARLISKELIEYKVINYGTNKARSERSPFNSIGAFLF